VLDALQAFNAQGRESLTTGSSRPKRTRLVVGAAQAEGLRALVHRSPRDFDQPTSVWTLERAAAVSVAQGIVPRRVSGETSRQALLRLLISWTRAKQWITSPDPAYARKKGCATAWSL
jgi:hypothetical protein